MRILIWHVHGSWTTSFVHGPHTYLLPVVPDRGPDGRYLPPTGAGWGGQADIERVRAWTAAGALRLELTMAGLSRGWNPANGFDRVAVITYLQLPGVAGGARVMPGQHAQLPADMVFFTQITMEAAEDPEFLAAMQRARIRGALAGVGVWLALARPTRRLTQRAPYSALGRTSWYPSTVLACCNAR